MFQAIRNQVGTMMRWNIHYISTDADLSSSSKVQQPADDDVPSSSKGQQPVDDIAPSSSGNTETNSGLISKRKFRPRPRKYHYQKP